MSTKTLLTRSSLPPHREGLLSRPRLLEHLRLSLSGKLILLTAPAGYGRTSLLLDLFHQHSQPVAWLALTENDRAADRLLSRLIVALGQLSPDLEQKQELLLEQVRDLESLHPRLAGTLAKELLARKGQHNTLVIDDYHFVAAVPGVPEFIQALLDRSPAGFHLVLSSRTKILLPNLENLIARGQVDSLGLADLAFRADELRALLEQQHGLRMSPAEAEGWIGQTEGWIQGLLISIDLPRTSALSRPGARAGLAGYFASQVFESQPEEMRSFLMLSACLGTFNAELCAEVLPALTGPRDWTRLIETARRDNLFILPADPDGRWLRYHPLFEQFLRERLFAAQPEHESRILEQLARFYLERNEWERAHSILERIGDPRPRAELLERVGSRLLQNGNPHLLRRWLRELPDELLDTSPRLLSLKGAALAMAGQVTVGLALLDRAISAFREEYETPVLALTLVRRSFTQRFLGNYQRCLEDAREAIRLIESQPDQRSVLAEAQRAMGLGYHRLGESDQAIRCLSQALELFRLLREEASLPIVMMDLGMVYRAVGDFTAAEKYYRQALERWQREHNLSWQANLLNNLGGLFHAQGKYQQAVTQFERGLRCARESGYARMEALLLTGLADLYAELEEPGAARTLYRQALEIVDASQDRFITVYAKLACAGLERQQGDLSQARLLLEQAFSLISVDSSSYETGLYHLGRGQYFLTCGDPASTIRELEFARPLFEKGNRSVEQRALQIWLAAARAQAGQIDLARSGLTDPLRQCEHGPNMHTTCLLLRQVADWLTPLQADPRIGRPLARALARGRQIQASFAGVRATLRHVNDSAALPPPSLSIRAFGPGQVWVNGQLVSKAEWQTQAVRDLFFFFLGRTDRVNKEQVGSEFWPDVSSNQLKLRFKNAIYRLRRAIGPDAIRFKDNLYAFNRTINYEYDVEAFEANLTQARHSGNLSERIGHYEAALALVRGPYLVDVDAGWAVPRRERLEIETRAALMELGDLYLENGQHNRALIVSERAIQHDGFMEEAYRLSMRAHAALGDRPAVARRYQVCRKMLREELGLEPSPETEELYRTLMD